MALLSTRMFTEEQLDRLRSFPDIDKDELIRFFTLTKADVAFVDPGRGRGPVDRLGLAVQLCTLPWLGFVPDDIQAAPQVAVARLAERLGLDPAVLAAYGKRDQTRSDHLRLVAGYPGWHQTPPDSSRWKELEQFLLDRAMEHDSPTLLFNLAREYLISAKVIRPGGQTLARIIATARTEATALTFQKVQHLLTPQMASELDRLLMVDVGLGKTRLAWLNERAVEATAASVKATTERLQFLRGMDAQTLDLTTLPAERRRFLVSVGRRSTNQALERRKPQRRHPILLALLGQSAKQITVAHPPRWQVQRAAVFSLPIAQLAAVSSRAPSGRGYRHLSLPHSGPPAARRTTGPQEPADQPRSSVSLAGPGRSCMSASRRSVPERSPTILRIGGGCFLASVGTATI